MVLGALLVVLAISVRDGKAAKSAHALSLAVTQAAAQKELWHCGMHPQVLQDHPGNCPICHMPLTPMKSTGAGDPPNGGKQLWWDPMLGPSSITDHPGKSAMGMDLVQIGRAHV